MFKLTITRKNVIQHIVSRDHFMPGSKMKWGTGPMWTVLRVAVNLDAPEFK